VPGCRDAPGGAACIGAPLRGWLRWTAEKGLHMPRDEQTFFCVIKDRALNEAFIARVKFAKKSPIKASIIDKGQVELADIYIWPLVERVKAWGPSLTEDDEGNLVADIAYRDTHSHFVLYDLSGQGKYIRRDNENRVLERRLCSVWDLGNPFGRNVSQLMTQMM
jgi:hypothetical protein